ncbi:MAG: SAM-dependent methyltransferase [Anaerolineae bacterium]|jgi:2-polyprenyl-3-methyl-5-hydroxy-6-metoxy-1,4-benzoquinol methylase|nr:MAG: SAM-dependent methyltransferase [Anaerolineae bacterium]
MARADAIRWNNRYREESTFALREPRSLLLEIERWLPRGGFALDLAMGVGQNAAFLLQKGFKVIGVDISLVALQQAKRRYPNLMTVCADLESFHLPQNTFDVILNFYFLQRSIWDSVRKWLKPNGLLIIETMTLEMKTVKPEIDERYLLEPGELKQTFCDFEILLYREGWQERSGIHPRAVASLVARKPDT